MINSEYKDLSEYKRNLICFKEIFEMYKESFKILDKIISDGIKKGKSI